jgi:hypothetical protein
MTETPELVTLSNTKIYLARFRTKSDPNQIRTRENMARYSGRTISMIIYALDPMSIIRFLSIILE